MQRLLVPIDFSEQAQNALQFARDIARMHEDVEITLLHAIEHPIEGYMDPSGIAITSGVEADLIGVLRDNATKQMTTFIGEVYKSNIDMLVNVTSKIEMGTPYEVIREELLLGDYQLVVMGTKGASGLKELLVGSNAEKVVRTANCPVITMQNHVSAAQIRDIVFATATLDDVTEELITKVKNLQNLFDATLHIVRINTPNNFERDYVVHKALKHVAQRYMLKDFTLNIYNDEYEEQGILSFAQQVNAGLIAMGTHGRTGFAHLLSGSIAEDVVNHAGQPIWTYHMK